MLSVARHSTCAQRAPCDRGRRRAREYAHRASRPRGRSRAGSVAALDDGRLHGGAVVGVTGPSAGVNPMAPASIRDAVPDDYDAFARFFAQLHAPEQVPSARVYEELVAPRAFFGVESGLPSAFLCWRPEGAVFHVSILAVLPERRRRGLGRQLML